MNELKSRGTLRFWQAGLHMPTVYASLRYGLGKVFLIARNQLLKLWASLLRGPQLTRRKVPGDDVGSRSRLREGGGAGPRPLLAVGFREAEEFDRVLKKLVL